VFACDRVGGTRKRLIAKATLYKINTNKKGICYEVGLQQLNSSMLAKKLHQIRVSK
jgi:hypothetical protein